jgi:hypothetical protein
MMSSDGVEGGWYNKCNPSSSLDPCSDAGLCARYEEKGLAPRAARSGSSIPLNVDVRPLRATGIVLEVDPSKGVSAALKNSRFSCLGEMCERSLFHYNYYVKDFLAKWVG